MIAVVDQPGPGIPLIASASPAVGVPFHATAPAVPPVGVSPVSIEAFLIPASANGTTELLLPFDPTVGAAAFCRNGQLDVVFDSRKPVDLSAATGDPAFQAARLTLLPTGTLVELPCDPSNPISLSKVQGGWLLSRHTIKAEPVAPEPVPDGMNFALSDVGDVLTITDPAGGGDLLVGTVRGDTHAVTAVDRSPGYRLVPSQLGLVVERLSDQVELRPYSAGFHLFDPFAPAGGYRPDPASSFSRSIELAHVDQAEQFRRYKAFLATSASLPAAARRGARLDAARAALALGFGIEARQLADIADQDTPGAPDRSVSTFLIGAGALLQGDPDAARLLADPVIGNSDEAALWRGLAVARNTPNDKPSLHSISDFWRLLNAYPAPLRQRIRGEAALALAKGGDRAARALVMQMPDQAGRAGLARALVSEGPDGDKQALAMLDRLYADRDPDVSLSAALEAIDLRLRDRQIDTEQAAKRTEALIYDGRMAGRESEVAIRAARLRAQNHEFKRAIAILRGEVQDGASPEIKRVAGTILEQAADAASAREADGKNSGGNVLGTVKLLQENQDLLPPDANRVALAARLAERLAAQDVPGQAIPFLQQAFAQAPSGKDKAALGLALSRSLLEQGDAKAAASTLESVPLDGLSPASMERLTLLHARILQAEGDRSGALAALVDLKDADALALKASMMGDNKDWQGEASALSALLAARMPEGPDGKPLAEENQELVLRLASALSRAGQVDAVRQLDRTWAASFTDRPKRDMLSLLGAADITSIDDLSRSAADLAAARSALKALGGGAG
ncbi:hypothetical protein NFI95_14640 [Acetobacteraceae bacterium KSS8]|uniref:Tetratricopeptide repeat protein n=1 Tax=Endosaccharibacter trunci TaxID=2812733 RepID=A0ABT1W9W6_9PROT|nr:hypothetical protein [Acetobacteraceae bacterium KSS8]